jgi:hypothetical protein
MIWWWQLLLLLSLPRLDELHEDYMSRDTLPK